MKINFKNISDILKTNKDIRQGFANEQKKNHDKSSEFQKVMAQERIGDMNYFDYIDEVFASVLSPNCKRYILTQSAWDVIDRIQIDKFDMNMLADKVPMNETLEFMIDSEHVYRVFFSDMYGENMLRGMRVNMESHPRGFMFNYHSFAFELHPDRSQPALETENVPQIQDVVDRWVKMLCFMYYSDPKFELLKAGHKYGKTRHDKIKNETKSDYTVVNSKWNTTVVRTDGFTVSMHPRWQPCGKDKKDRKLIMIDEFQKNGYTRRSGKLIDESNE